MESIAELHISKYLKHLEDKRRVLNEFLNNPTRDTLKKVFESFWSYEAIVDKEKFLNRVLKKRIKPTSIAQRLKYLIDESKPLNERLTVRIHGFGSKAKTEVLNTVYPDKYPVLNKRTLYVLNKVFNISREYTIKEYNEFINVCEVLADGFLNIREDYRKLLSREIPKYAFLDYVLNTIYERMKAKAL